MFTNVLLEALEGVPWVIVVLLTDMGLVHRMHGLAHHPGERRVVGLV